MKNVDVSFEPTVLLHLCITSSDEHLAWIDLEERAEAKIECVGPRTGSYVGMA